MVSDNDPQECIFFRGEEGDFDCGMPNPLSGQLAPGESANGKSIMGYRVTIDGQEFTVPANKCKFDPNRPGWMEVTIDGKTYHVHMSNAKPISVPIVYFVMIEDDIQVIPAKYIRRDPDYPDKYVLVTFKGKEYRIPISDCTLMDGTPMQPGDLPDENSPIYGGDGSYTPPDRMYYTIPDGAPLGGHFGPDGTYYGPDGRPYGKGTPAPYRIPEGAPEGGYFDADGNYYGPDGQCYGPGTPFTPEDWAYLANGDPNREIPHLPKRCSVFCIVCGGARMRRRRRRSLGIEFDSDDDGSCTSSSSCSSSSSSSSSNSGSGRRRHSKV